MPEGWVLADGVAVGVGERGEGGAELGELGVEGGDLGGGEVVGELGVGLGGVFEAGERGEAGGAAVHCVWWMGIMGCWDGAWAL